MEVFAHDFNQRHRKTLTPPANVTQGNKNDRKNP
ncbi:hypothetical protein T4A_11575 [Trichinella pseudospiralis]|uniref:Uncharacterized protein n=1 Tax=Trichinella pseudospiralis TaxID=6337 RepID=A0A0V1DQJ4_TRIPS|nr:hypothetical protein T4A_11575 [Trichinella pseudospiralis]